MWIRDITSLRNYVREHIEISLHILENPANCSKSRYFGEDWPKDIDSEKRVALSTAQAICFYESLALYYKREFARLEAEGLITRWRTKLGYIEKAIETAERKSTTETQ